MQQVSDDYYLQDFSTNLALVTQRQLLRQADLTYSIPHWTFMGMTQSYQTLHPVNEPPILSAYERLPELQANGLYNDLPFHARLALLGQYDQFHWQAEPWLIQDSPQGPRFHANPILSVPLTRLWGYVTPSIELVENYYEVQNKDNIPNDYFNRAIPRYSVDSGLYFDRDFKFKEHSFTQTLEPRLFYLNVPYQNQTAIPVYDSAFMIFNVDQLFRTNRFSGYDRIGDANQLAYAVTSRWLNGDTGIEKANLSIGQLKYFADRRVTLCQSRLGYCVDNPLMMGYLSPTYGYSPVASRAAYRLNSTWSLTGVICGTLRLKRLTMLI